MVRCSAVLMCPLRVKRPQFYSAVWRWLWRLCATLFVVITITGSRQRVAFHHSLRIPLWSVESRPSVIYLVNFPSTLRQFTVALSIGVNFLQIVGGSWPLPPLPSPPSLSPPLPLEVGPPNPARGLGERCKLPQRGLGRSPSRNRIWCILALKSGHLVATILMIFVRVNWTCVGK